MPELPHKEPQSTPSISVSDLVAKLRGPDELALIDVSEEGQFGLGHMLLAVNIPFSLLELQTPTLVPRKNCPIILVDHGGDIAGKAARRLRAIGYTDLHLLDGGVKAWEKAGHQLFQGIYVPSKAFGEWVEHHFHTPCVSPDELASLIERQADICILDPRTVPEHAANHIPGAISCPSAELVYRFDDLVPSAQTLVVVACGGRTRGIIGAQSLIDAAVPNRVVALADGNHGWKLAGLQLEDGLRRGYGSTTAQASQRASDRAARMRDSYQISQVDLPTVQRWQADPDRTTVLLDVRTAEEFAAGHLDGARHAPGGQLLQAADRWLGTLGARVVVVDSAGARAAMICRWLRCMNWDAYALTHADATASTRAHDTAAVALRNAGQKSADEAARVSVEPQRRAFSSSARVSARQAEQAIRAGAVPVSLDRSSDYLLAHPPGARWANRARLEPLLELLRLGRSLVLFSADGGAADLAAIDLREGALHPDEQVKVVDGGMRSWQEKGLPVVSAEESGLAQEDRLDTLYWLHDRRTGNKEAMRQYLAWEKSLLGKLELEGYKFQPPEDL